MDEIDIASEREEELRAKALLVRKPEGPPPDGKCYHCGSRVFRGHRWCDSDCEKDWSRLQLVEKSNAGKYYDDE